ncbi:NAD(P)/FAD-dependent oxidoreductase [Leptolyngbya sp. GB1-A1]|uniref:NAD(P)/FAD-dependent oxidoreductase n=3 Tax=Leptolyngbya TaxID=47251 RepID=UPI001987FB57|nr:NAD(P)/FAD-dependent oxidoreductase [Cyanobacteria bacterium FACHB-502]
MRSSPTLATSRPLQILVVGGGAGGFFAAIVCAEAHPQAQVTLFEAGSQPLSKVRISGGGRCNVTHACFDPAALIQFYPRGGKALRGAFTRFQPKDTIAWFAKRGVTLKTEADGRMFPVTDNSETVVDCLTQAALRAGVKIYTAAPVSRVTKENDYFVLTLKSGQEVRGDRLLLASGSSPQGFQLAKSLGHSVEPPVPSLFTFNVPDSQLHELAGVSVESAKVQLFVPEGKPIEQIGPVLITHWGLSGPAVLKLSAWGARILHQHRYQATVRINWLPTETAETVRQTLLAAKTEFPRKSIAAHNPFTLPRRLWQFLTMKAGVGETDDSEGGSASHRWADFSKQAMNRLIQQLMQTELPVKGKGVFKEEFVTCGGIRLKDVNFQTMESRCCPGLYFAGEILDIDGITGGFNFQSAWTTGWLAGQAMGASFPDAEIGAGAKAKGERVKN